MQFVGIDMSEERRRVCAGRGRDLYNGRTSTLLAPRRVYIVVEIADQGITLDQIANGVWDNKQTLRVDVPVDGGNRRRDLVDLVKRPNEGTCSQGNLCLKYSTRHKYPNEGDESDR